jgi:hypothetical protein
MVGIESAQRAFRDRGGLQIGVDGGEE